MSSMFSCRFLQDDENCSEVAYSKYQILFFIRLLNLFGFFSRSRWNLQQIAASFKWKFLGCNKMIKSNCLNLRRRLRSNC